MPLSAISTGKIDAAPDSELDAVIAAEVLGNASTPEEAYRALLACTGLSPRSAGELVARQFDGWESDATTE